jgi:DNA replication protein DnaC
MPARPSADAPRHSEPKRLTDGPLEELTKPCGRCGVAVTRSVYPAGTTFGDIERATAMFCDACTTDLDAEEAEEAEREAVAAEAERRRRIFEAANIPPIFRDATFERCRRDGVPEHAVAAAERWGAGDLRGLLLVGPVGVGKSTLAAAAVSARIAGTARAAFWLTAPEMFAALGSGFENPTRDRVLTTLQSGRALVVDDVDKGRPTAYGAEQIYLAIDQRIVRQAPLLVTSNLDLEELRDRWPEEYGPAIVSRLVGHCELIAIKGPDRRLAAAENA